MTKKLLIPFAALIITGCSIIKPYTYKVCVAEPGQQSVLDQNKLIRTEGYKIVHINGQVTDKNTSKPITQGSAIITNVAEHINTAKTLDSLGRFKHITISGQYHLTVKCLGYADLDTTILLRKGEIRKLKIAMGKAQSYSTIKIKSGKKLSDEELATEVKKLKKAKKRDAEIK